MAITFPRELPDYIMQESTFTLMAGTASSAFAGGTRTNISQIVDPTWRGAFQTGLLERISEQAWSAWWNSLRGGLRTFVAYDVKRSNPLAYLSAVESTDISSGWAGTATVTSVGASGALGLSNLPSSYQAKAGDRIGLEQTVSSRAYYGYYEVLENVTASGGAVTLTVAPFLQSIFTTSAVARLWRPKCQFVIDWRSLDMRGLADPTPMAFEAYQRLS